MNIDWQQIITALGGYTILATAIAWLAQTVITHVLSKDVERYKTELDNKSKLHQQELELNQKAWELQLKSQFDLALAKANSEFQIMAKENEIRFTKLHEYRIKVISDFYLQLEDLLRETYGLEIELELDPSKEQMEYANKLWLKSHEVAQFFRKNKLYFSKHVADEIEKYLSMISEPSGSYVSYKLFEGTTEDLLKILSEWKTNSGDAERICEFIEAEFREMLGIENKKKTL